MNQTKSNRNKISSDLQQLPALIRAAFECHSIGKSPARDPHWLLVDSPEHPDCIPDDRDVPILTTEAGVRFVRTPEECFKNLPGYPFKPYYAIVEGLRMHYVDEGPKDGPIILMLHGQPSWSYLYRKMIPPLVQEGYRVIAVDHIGMGRSDKPVDLGFHTFEKHVSRLKKFIAEVSLKDITLFCQDWGGLMGLRVAGDQPDLFSRVIAANTTLPILPKWLNPFRVPNPVKINSSLGDLVELPGSNRAKFVEAFQKWILYALTVPNLTPSQVIDAGTVSTPSMEELSAYNAPYPSMIYKAAVGAFPSMIAAIERQNVPAWKSLGNYKKPFLFFGGSRIIIWAPVPIKNA